ncbi:PAN domain-containing protein [Marinibacterium profundimaris]|uniref:PAN domain-containing protein n=1 Tax=Marinibacterium profundimaris TaxID=1679460 RepID=A0A225NNV8_9RHOB|nr:PAN domain-containing protein [Marinibacterium profundimaris]
MFDTDLDSCLRQCAADAACAAFTFNARSNSCFPKSTISDRQPYEGAISAAKVPMDLGLLQSARARAADIDFLGDDVLAAAGRQARDLGLRHSAGGADLNELLQGARASSQAGDPARAMRFIGMAVSVSDRADLWTEYARLLLALDGDSAEQRRFADRALRASANGYLRATSPGQGAAALIEMSEALERVNRGRDMIRALRLAQATQPRPDIDEALEEAIRQYGFRVADTRVDSDAAAPRICVEFSEELIRAGQDYAPFVGLDDDRLAVVAEGQSLCLDGVEHGERYRFTLREGLPAASGETLWKDVEITQYVRDRGPSVRFPGRSYVLPRAAGANLPVETVNTTELDLVLQRVSDRNLVRAFQEDMFARPLSYWQAEQFSDAMAEEVWTGTAEVETTLNRDMTTRLPMGEAIADQPPGIYTLTARIPGADPYDQPGATQWFVLTDLGLATLSGSDGLHVDVRSLAETTALDGVSLQLVSRANAVLGEAETDAEGHALFAPGLARGTGAAAPALIVARTGDDMAFLSLTDPAFDLSDRGVEGRPSPGPVDVFLTTDRGAYRAGESIHATALARDAEAAAIPDMPLIAILKRPDGVEHARIVSDGGVAGGHVFDIALGETVPRGPWTLDIHVDADAPPLASQALLVEDFLPERIDFDLSLPAAPLRPGDVPPLTVEARYLFGAPGADLDVEGSVLLSPAETVEAWPGYRFGRHDTGLSPVRSFFGGERTDADGIARIAVEIPQMPGADRPLQAQVTARVADGAARPVERRISAPVLPSGPVIGIKPRFDDMMVPEGAEAGFDIIALSPALEQVEMQVQWTLNRVETRYQWYQLYGNWTWEPIERRTRVASGMATPGRLAASVSAQVDWGQYELVVERVGGDYTAASVSFDAGWYAAADAATTPDRLEMSLDAASYSPGDTAILRLVPRNAGTALISVMSDRVIARQAVEVPEGASEIPLEVTEAWGTGAYVTATVLRPMDVAEALGPARALGVAHAAISPGDKALDVALDIPGTVQPRSTVPIGIEVDGMAEGETAWVTLAAVDLGILNLTGFESPDPQAHYFGQRRLGVEMRDVYGRLIDGMTGAMGRVRSGGDAGDGLRRESPPPTQELMAVFDGPVQIGPDGRAEVQVPLPAFNGTVRLMAVAWSDTGVGQAQADMLVRDPVVATLITPRFLAPGDQSRISLELIHADGPAGKVALSLDAPGLEAGALPASVTLGEGATERLRLPVTAGEVGDYPVTLTLTTPDGTELTQTITLPVRSNDPAVAETRRFRLSQGESFTFDDNVFANLRPGTGEALISAGPLARFDVPGLLAQLDRYPYGCTEQVTSQALPLLYLSSVSGAMGLPQSDVDTRIAQAVDRILTRQAPNGAFGLWRPDSGEFWLDAYVTDFLSRARAGGHAVPDLAFSLAMDNLRNRINYAPDFDEGGEDIAYALMVLAREGQASMADLRYFADVKSGDFSTALSLAQLGAALASYGDQLRADEMFHAASAKLGRESLPQDVWRADFGSDLRDAAGLLRLAVVSGSDAVDLAPLVQRVSAPSGRRSTQESAWTLLAAEALVQSPEVSGLLIDGAPAQGPFVRLRESGDAGEVVITADGDRAVDVTVTTIGVPDVPPPAGGAGYVITREYYGMDGARLDPGDWAVGDRFVTVLRVTSAEPVGARLIIDDPLPAGFEIDNPNLLRSGDVGALSWLDPTEADHAEFRSDRFVAAVNVRGGAPVTLAYVTRAVSPGSYHHPAATVEAMYRPDRRARTATGRVTIAQ